jgi:hypothetical protein
MNSAEHGNVMIVTFDILKDWTENGLMQNNQDVYAGKPFSENEEQRFILKFSKKDKVIDFLTKLRKKKVSVPNHLNLYRVRYDNKQLHHVFTYVPQAEYESEIFPSTKTTNRS